MDGVSVCIPVGPYAWYKKYLKECLESVMAQTIMPHDIVIVDDMANVTPEDLGPLMRNGDVMTLHPEGMFPLVIRHDTGEFVKEFVRVWRSPWLLGIPGCANVGIALGQTNLVFQLSCDDKLKPDCLEECWKEWERRQDPLGYYWVGVEYSTGETQALACGHAMIPKALWRHTGGWPVESAIGACDAAFISAMMTHAHGEDRMGTLYAVDDGRPLYWHREHDEQYTKHQHTGPGAILEVRKWFTDNWESPKWGRYEP